MLHHRVLPRVARFEGVKSRSAAGLRIPVATVVDVVADGMPNDEILAAYPDLEAADIEEALHYAAEAVRERELPLAAAG